MLNKKHLWSLGIMSGTSLDAIDLAMLKTDGEVVLEHGAADSVPIPSEMQAKLQGLMQGSGNFLVGDFLAIEQCYSKLVADAVCAFIATTPTLPDIIAKPDIIGFHGQTIIHRPKEGITWQLGNPHIIAHQTGIKVVSDFRRRDMAAGGQGAPLVPLYHTALAHALPKPLAIVNIGGVANVTYIGEHELLAPQLIAFDTGTGNALLNDWVNAHTGEAYDDGGAYALAGKVHSHIVEASLAHPYFASPPPKSLDRNEFNLNMAHGLSLHDGAATLMQFTVGAIIAAGQYFPTPPKQWIICGGGVHNNAMMAALQAQLSAPVVAAETLGWRSDAIEAEAFAFLAVRSLRGLPLSTPHTTGAGYAITGGSISG